MIQVNEVELRKGMASVCEATADLLLTTCATAKIALGLEPNVDDCRRMAIDAIDHVITKTWMEGAKP